MSLQVTAVSVSCQKGVAPKDWAGKFHLLGVALRRIAWLRHEDTFAEEVTYRIGHHPVIMFATGEQTSCLRPFKGAYRAPLVQNLGGLVGYIYRLR